ncbi:MAG: transglutaminase-like domain-containing protein [Tepidisphaerales bacterium]
MNGHGERAMPWASAMLTWVAGVTVALAIAGPSSRAWMYPLIPTAMLLAAWGLRRSGLRLPPWTPLGFAGADLLVSGSPAGGALLSGVSGGAGGLGGGGAGVAGVFPASFELLLLSVLRGLAIGLLCGPVPRPGTAAVLSGFILVLAGGLVPEAWRVVMLTAGAGVGAAALVAAYRSGRFAASAARSGPTRWATVVTVVAAVGGAAVSGGLIRPDHAPSRGLWALLPTSGGPTAGSERARSGLGDGPDEARGGRDVRTTGFDLGDVFVNSDHPGLYDAFIEAFGEPVKRTEQMRMIGLRREQIITSDRHTAQDLRSGQTLQLRRSPPRPSSPQADERGAGAVLLVRGPAPLRVRLAVYDLYDGQSHAWRETPPPKHNAALYPNTPAPGWMQLVDAPDSPLLGQAVRHEIRVGELDTDVLPMPELVTAFKLGRVDRADFFAGSPEHVFRLFNRRVPAGAVLEVTSRPAVLESVAARDADPPVRLPPAPELLADAVRSLAASWCVGRPTGWAEVLAVVEAVRGVGQPGVETAKRLEDVASTFAPDDVEAFLLGRQAGRSPDFATATALVLRSLGYSVRVAGGFYVRPERYDARSGMYRVTAADAHVWPEVRTRSGLWVPLEPTPGFQLAAGRMSWGQWWAAAAARLADWAVGHAVPLTAAAAVVVVGAWQWRRLCSLAATLWWWVAPGREPRERVRRTLALLRRRRSLACPGRELTGLTPRQFLLEADPEAARLASVADWACYAPPDAPPPRGEVERLCRWAVHRLTFSHFKRLTPRVSQGPAAWRTQEVA